MSTISGETKAESVFSQRVSGERRSFFFDVRRGAEGSAYLTVSQFVRVADEWVRLKIVVPAQDARPFYQGLCEAIKALRAAEVESGDPPAKAPQPADRSTQRASA